MQSRQALAQATGVLKVSGQVRYWELRGSPQKYCRGEAAQLAWLQRLANIAASHGADGPAVVSADDD